MKLTLRRREHKSDGIFSELLGENGKIIAQCLEHAYNVNGKYEPKLTNGTHKCVRGIHQLHNLKPFETFEILGVPGHTGILFHVGNWNEDSDGCVLVGSGIAQSPKGQMITASRQSFSDLMIKLIGLNEFTLEVE